MQLEKEIPLSCRLSICLYGPLKMWQRAADGTWKPIEKEAWGKGRTARSVFKRLLTAPGRRLSRGTIQDDLWPDTENFDLADKNIYNAINQIRRVIGKTLVLTRETSYEIADQSVIWVDSDACEILLKQAENRGYTSTQAHPLLEQALTLLEQGEWLEGESGTWVYGLRKKSEGLLRQCRLWLAESYEMHDKLLQAGLQYQTMILQDSSDEEALQYWLEMLARNGKRQEALKCYQDMKGFMKAQGFPLSNDLEQMIAFPKQPPVVLSSSVQEFEGELPLQQDLESFSPSVILSVANDPPLWFGEKVAALLTTIESQCGQPKFCSELQKRIGKELNIVQPMNEDEKYMSSRRQLLIALATFPTALLFNLVQRHSLSNRIEPFLARCSASITACWHLMKGSDYTIVEEILPTYLPLLATLVREPSKYQRAAAGLTTQGYRLKGILALHRNDATARDTYFQQAIHYAQIAQEPGLLVAALISLAYHKHNPQDAELLYQKANMYRENISPLQCSRLYVQLAVAYAQVHRIDESLRYLDLALQVYPDVPDADSSFLYAEFSPSSLNMEVGRVHLALAELSADSKQHSQNAWKAFASIESSNSLLTSSERIHYETVNYQAQTALALDDLDLCCKYIEQGIQGATLLKSAKRQSEILAVRNKALKVWPYDKRIQALAR